jgi:hypothetical protein
MGKPRKFQPDAAATEEHGPSHLKPMTMGEIADALRVSAANW